MGSATTADLPPGVTEHDGMLWKPRRGSTTTAEEFIAARTLFIELNNDAMWNAWIWDERKDDIDRAAEVMSTWRRAEPGHRHMSLRQWEAKQERREKAREREREKRQKLRESRKSAYDTERAAARLSLLEHQSRLTYELDELQGFRDGTKFPAMAPAERQEEISKVETAVARHEAEIERLGLIVGDPDDVIDANGWLPNERRETMLLHYKYDREREVRRIKKELPELKVAAKEEPDRSKRSRIQVKLSMDTTKLEHLLAVPPLTPADMCADCATPVSEHGWVTPPSSGPCPAWPGQVAIRKKARVAKLTELQDQYPNAEVRRGRANQWELWAPESDPAP